MNEFENIEEAKDTETMKPKEEEGPKFNMKKEILEWAQAIIFAVVIAFLIRTFVFTVVKVDGPSMQETLHHNDRLIVWRLGVEPEQGDIIIFHPASNPSSCYVKRVIAVGGQSVRVDYDENAVYVDGEKIDEPYISEKMEERFETGEIQVPEGYVFAMGDNRNNSSDSSDPRIGFISKKSILGKAVLRFWPFSSFGTF